MGVSTGCLPDAGAAEPDPARSWLGSTFVEPPLLLVLDGNSLLHRAYHAQESSGQRTHDGRPCWALNGFWSQLLAAVNRVDPAAVLVAFDDAATNERKLAYPAYKAHRADKPAALSAQLAWAPQHLARAGLAVRVEPGAEADDVLASAAAHAEATGWRCVLTTSDRDSFALISEQTSVLRIINGGVPGSPLLTPARLRILTHGIGPEQYRAYAALRGDSSDNLPGVPGIGPKTALRLLTAFPTISAALAEHDAGGPGLVAAVGAAAAARLASAQAREILTTNLALMTMRSDVGLPDLDEMRIPIPPGDLLAELEEWNLGGVANQACWLLTDPSTYLSRRPSPSPGWEQPGLW